MPDQTNWPDYNKALACLTAAAESLERARAEGGAHLAAAERDYEKALKAYNSIRERNV